MPIIKSLYFLLLISVVHQVSAETQTSELYKDWRKTCETVESSSAQVCHIFQNITAKSDGRTILHVAVGTLPSQQQATIIFTLPLGVGLPPGIVFIIDEGEQNKLNYNVCSNKGCLAGLKMTPELIQQFKAGREVKVSFANAQNQVFTVPLSLSGFTAGFNALSQGVSD